MNLIEVTKGIQRALPGVAVDGIAGMQTMLAIHRMLQQEAGITPEAVPGEQIVRIPDGGSAPSVLNARTLKNIGTLDERVRGNFIRFAELAQATAASYGCEYVMISGYRTWEEQAVLYKASGAGGPHAVAPGFSMHNYKIAGDFGVFWAGCKIYMDDGAPSQQATAEKIHHACAIHAAACKLIAGSQWAGKSHDDPHYQYDIGHATPTAGDREKFQATGSVVGKS